MQFLCLGWVKRAHPQDSNIFWFLDTARVSPCQGEVTLANNLPEKASSLSIADTSDSWNTAYLELTSKPRSFILVNLHVHSSTSLNPMPNPHGEMFHEIPNHAEWEDCISSYKGMWWHLKGLVHPKMKTQSSFTHPHPVPKLHEPLPPAEHKRRHSKERR